MKKSFIGKITGSLLLLLLACTARSATHDLLLLTRYQSGMQISGWLMSEKFDGVRAYWNGKQLLSRQGNRLFAPGWFTADFPPFELDGELWIARGQFQKTQSISSHQTPNPDWNLISYNIFEVPNAPGGLETRLEKLVSYLSTRPIAHLRIIPQTICLGTEHLLQHLTKLEEMGAEGLVLRNPKSLYQTGRSPNALKVKRFDDNEGTVIGYRPGKGKYRGQTGSLWIEIEDGLRFYIGSGLSDQERVTPPPIGSTVTFKYHGLTRDGIPRFATFLRVRVDH